jgi:hypothetical protein
MLLLSSCATPSRTKYGKGVSEAEGFSDYVINENFYVSRFAGNAHTHKNDAMLFSHFRAVDKCRELGFMYARIWETRDLTTSKTVTRSSSSSYSTPQNVYGQFTNAPLGGGVNFNGSVSNGMTFADTDTWNETYHYPSFDSVYSCVNGLWAARIRLKDLSAEEMKPYVSDFMGAQLVEEVMEGSPNNTILFPGDVILKINKIRVQSIQNFNIHLTNYKNKSKIPIEILRDGKRLSLNIKAVNSGSILVESNGEILKAACSVPEIATHPICKK